MLAAVGAICRAIAADIPQPGNAPRSATDALQRQRSFGSVRSAASFPPLSQTIRRPWRFMARISRTR
jgi:hypothetical protein